MSQEQEITISRSHAQSLALLAVSAMFADKAAESGIDNLYFFEELETLTRVVARRLEGVTLYSGKKSTWLLQPLQDKAESPLTELLKEGS